jgi:hypothetical protein
MIASCFMRAFLGLAFFFSFFCSSGVGAVVV